MDDKKMVEKMVDKKIVADTVQVEKNMLESMMKEINELKEKVQSKELDTQIPDSGKQKEVEEYLNEKVPFFAFKDDDKYKDDIVVGINGKNWQIQRGKKVLIPRFVYESIMDAERQRMDAAVTSKKYADQFAEETKIRKI